MEEFIVKSLTNGGSLRGAALLFEMLRLGPEGQLLDRIAGAPAGRALAFVCQAVRQMNFYVSDRTLQLINRLLVDGTPAAGDRCAFAVLKRLQFIRMANDVRVPVLQEYVRNIRNSPLIEHKQQLERFWNRNYLDVDDVRSLKVFLDRKAIELIRSFNSVDGSEFFIEKVLVRKGEWNAPDPVLARQVVERLRGLMRLFGVPLLLQLNVELLPLNEFHSMPPCDQMMYFRSVYRPLLDHHCMLSELTQSLISDHHDTVRLCMDPAVQ